MLRPMNTLHRLAIFVLQHAGLYPARRHDDPKPCTCVADHIREIRRDLYRRHDDVDPSAALAAARDARRSTVDGSVNNR